MRPDKVAVICNEVRLTFSELNLEANKLANWLLSKGLKKGDRAVMLLPNCAEFAVAYFALMKVGVITVILDFRLSPPEIAPLFDETEAKVLITHYKQRTFGVRMLREKENIRHVIIVGEEKAEENGLCYYERIVMDGDSSAGGGFAMYSERPHCRRSIAREFSPIRSVMRRPSPLVKPSTSTCVTPAYRRVALPFGQHISSTQSKPSSAANCTTFPSGRSGRMALTNPSCMVTLLPV